jgi:trehalose 6-phosphate phosphatase
VGFKWDHYTEALLSTDLKLPTGFPPVELDARRTALFLDIDGTLLEIASRPESVIVPPDLVGLLCDLRDRLDGALAILSGRALASIDALFEPVHFIAAGCHGAQIRLATGELELGRPVPDWAVRAAMAIPDAIPGVLVENKINALSVHYRAIPERAAEVLALTQPWRERLASEGFAMLPGKSVVDIKPADVSKGTATRKYMAAPPFAGRTPVFAGDDITDQEVLSVLPEFGGTGISVGRKLNGASFVIATPKLTRDWLKQQAGQLKDKVVVERHPA